MGALSGVTSLWGALNRVTLLHCITVATLKHTFFHTKAHLLVMLKVNCSQGKLLSRQTALKVNCSQGKLLSDMCTKEVSKCTVTSERSVFS